MTHTAIKNGQGAPSTLTPMTDTNNADFASHGPIQQAHDGQAVADQVARLTRAGHVVHQSGLGDFLVTKYGLSRYCAGFDELKAFAQKVGANHVQS